MTTESNLNPEFFTDLLEFLDSHELQIVGGLSQTLQQFTSIYELKFMVESKSS